jgi:hypothetical protein
MTYITNREFPMEVRQGKTPNFTSVNKFGFATDCDQNVATDIWDGADGTTSTDVWVPPTAARTHDLSSTSGNDIEISGSGCRTIEVYGLTDWDTAEVSETVTMNGTGNSATSNSYVIIHRMVCRTFGSGATNAGIITATAQTDGTVTAAVKAGEGQTLMAIYGVPSTQNIYLKQIHASILRGVSASGDLTLLVEEDVDLATSGFITKDRFTFENASPVDRLYWVPKKFNGPCIVKLQVSASANNSQVTAGFDGYVVTE